MPLSLRTTLLSLLVVTALLPLALFAWAEMSYIDAQAQAHEQATFENVALAAAVRADAAASQGGDPLRAATQGVPAGWRVLLVDSDGAWRDADGSRGESAALAALLGETLSGIAAAPEPESGADAKLAWSRAPAADAAVVLVRPIDDGDSPQRAAFFAVLGMVAAGALLMAVTVSARVVRPVHGLARASNALAAGRSDVRAPVDGSREIRHLARAFNAMADDITRQHAELAEWSSELDRLVEDRTESLVESRMDLDAMQFTVAHELREPLRSLRIVTGETLRDGDPQEAIEVLGMVSSRVERLERILLELMRYDEVARRDAPMAEVDLGRALDSALARVHEEHGRVVVIEREPLPRVVANESLVVDAFVEIVKNVAQHGGGRMRLFGEVDGDEARILFDDEGPGVPPGRREDPFLLFQRLRATEGTGVGLAIVRRVAARHDGDARIESAPGGGARLALRLPIAGPAQRAPAPALPDRRAF